MPGPDVDPVPSLGAPAVLCGVPWAHLDIAGPAQCDDAAGWRTPGGTGFGARLLVELALAFEAP